METQQRKMMDAERQWTDAERAVVAGIRREFPLLVRYGEGEAILETLGLPRWHWRVWLKAGTVVRVDTGAPGGWARYRREDVLRAAGFDLA